MTNEVEVAPLVAGAIGHDTVMLRAVTDGEVQLVAIGEVAIRE